MREQERKWIGRVITREKCDPCEKPWSNLALSTSHMEMGDSERNRERQRERERERQRETETERESEGDRQKENEQLGPTPTWVIAPRWSSHS